MNWFTDISQIRRIQRKIDGSGERTKNIVTNVFGTFIIRGGSVLIQLILIPLLINYLDSERFGIWVTLTSLVVWVNALDIGLGNGLKNRLAESIARGDKELSRTIVSTAYCFLTVIATFFFILFTVLNNLINWSTLLKVDTEISNELSIVMFILVLNFCVQFVLKIYISILQAKQAYAEASFNVFLGSLLTLAVIFLITKISPNKFVLVTIIPIICTNLILLIVSYSTFRKRLSDLKPTVHFINIKYGKTLLNLSVVFFIIQVTNIVLFNFSNILIIRNFSGEDVTSYNIAFRYFSTISIIVGIIISPFWTGYTDAFAKKDYLWMKSAYRRMKSLGYISGVVILFFILFARWIYKIWIGPEVVIPITLNLAVALSVFTSINLSYNHMIINGVGKIKLQMYIAIVSAVLFFPVALFLLKILRVEGIVLATVMYNVTAWSFSSIQVKKILNNNTFGIWDK